MFETFEQLVAAGELGSCREPFQTMEQAIRNRFAYFQGGLPKTILYPPPINSLLLAGSIPASTLANAAPGTDPDPWIPSSAGSLSYNEPIWSTNKR